MARRGLCSSADRRGRRCRPHRGAEVGQDRAGGRAVKNTDRPRGSRAVSTGTSSGETATTSCPSRRPPDAGALRRKFFRTLRYVAMSASDRRAARAVLLLGVPHGRGIACGGGQADQRSLRYPQMLHRMKRCSLRSFCAPASAAARVSGDERRIVDSAQPPALPQQRWAEARRTRSTSGGRQDERRRLGAIAHVRLWSAGCAPAPASPDRSTLTQCSGPAGAQGFRGTCMTVVASTAVT